MGTAAALLSLTKPRIAALLCLTGTAATFAAGGLPPGPLAAFVVAGAGMAGGAAALNCYYDRDLDPAMERTVDRPLVRGTLSPRTALAFGVGLLVLASAVALAALPLRSVAYMWLGVASYLGLYTVLLKRRHWMGVVLGGSAGSFPVLAGWSAVRPLALPAVGMAALVFAWTPAHAWALAVVYREDFVAAGVPTLPAVASPPRTRRAVGVAAASTLLVAVALVPVAGLPYAAALLVAAPPFLFAYRTFAGRGGRSRAARAFFTSNAFLAVLFLGWGAGGVTAHRLVAPAVAVLAGAVLLATWAARPALGDVRAAGPPGTRFAPSRSPARSLRSLAGPPAPSALAGRAYRRLCRYVRD